MSARLTDFVQGNIVIKPAAEVVKYCVPGRGVTSLVRRLTGKLRRFTIPAPARQILVLKWFKDEPVRLLAHQAHRGGRFHAVSDEHIRDLARRCPNPFAVRMDAPLG